MEITDLHLKNKKLNEINQTLNQLLSELHEASANEFKAMKLEMEALRAEMLEELGLDDGKCKFDIEDEIPSSPEKEYEFKYAQEADKYNDVIVEEGSDSSDEETIFHYSRIDETFPSHAEIFKEQN
ncbi:hypothetical protein Hanom_Chr13g01205571 [Helianthus anomalus]